MAVLQPIVFAFQGSSLTTGRLSADWVPILAHDLPLQPEAVGPIHVYNMGKGSQTSAWGVTNAPEISKLKPTHILTEGFGINDSVDFGGGPAITRPQHIINIQTFVAEWVTNIPGVDIGIMSMSPVSAAGAAIRPALADYYADEIATGTTLGIRTLDNYAGWVKPLPAFKSYGAAPSGAAGWGGTWNPADKSVFVALSGGNLIATGSSNDRAVRGTVGLAAGSTYFDVLMGANIAAVGASVGILNAGANLETFVGATGGYGYTAGGDIWSAGVKVGYPGPYSTGDLIGCYVDRTVSRIWWAKNGVWVNGDPVSGVGGVAFTAGTYYPALSLSNTQTATGNFAAVYSGDGLHPIWAGAVDTYLSPSVLAYCRARMGEFW